MKEKRTPVENEVPKYKKKSKQTGQPRADHKHEYKEVILHSWWDNPFKPGVTNERTHVCKVCEICGRIGDYVTGLFEEIDETKYDPMQTEHWCVDKYFDKFAKKME